jgi:hypothetical protein
LIERSGCQPMPPKFSGFGLASSLKKGARPALAAFKDDETKRPPPGQQAQAEVTGHTASPAHEPEASHFLGGAGGGHGDRRNPIG